MLDINTEYFETQLTRNWDKGFSLGFTPIWIHKHAEKFPYHLHVLLNVGFWFLEIRIGRD